MTPLIFTVQFATWPETKRYPTSWAQGASSQNNLVGPILDNNRVSFMDRLYNLFTNYHNFTQFGNEAWMVGSAVENADSLESIHDAIHAITGSSGHMTYLDYSAYDPIFWLHHGMIDRCFALFQALNPDTYVEPMQALEQTFTISTNEKIDVNSRESCCLSVCTTLLLTPRNSAGSLPLRCFRNQAHLDQRPRLQNPWLHLSRAGWQRERVHRSSGHQQALRLQREFWCPWQTWSFSIADARQARGHLNGLLFYAWRDCFRWQEKGIPPQHPVTKVCP